MAGGKKSRAAPTATFRLLLNGAPPPAIVSTMQLVGQENCTCDGFPVAVLSCQKVDIAMQDPKWTAWEVEAMEHMTWVWPFTFGIPALIDDIGIIYPPLAGWANSTKQKLERWYEKWRDAFNSLASGNEYEGDEEYLSLLRTAAESAFSAGKSEFGWSESDLDEFLDSFPPFPSQEE